MKKAMVERLKNRYGVTWFPENGASYPLRVFLYKDCLLYTSVLMTAKTGNTYEVLEDMGNGWMKVRVNDSEGFLPVSGNATVEQVGESEMAEVQQDAIESSDTYKRQQVVNYAMQFVGGRYKYGGSDPRTGTDCSGFTRYVLQNSAGISMNRSSGGQAQQGIAISADQMQPGDLIFYGSGRSINHVAMYIGNGQIVHASTERTGITVSNWNYRNPVKIVNCLLYTSRCV